MLSAIEVFGVGVALSIGAAVGCAAAFGAFLTFDYARNFVLRYRQSARYPEEIEQRFWPRAKWAISMLGTLL